MLCVCVTVDLCNAITGSCVRVVKVNDVRCVDISLVPDNVMMVEDARISYNIPRKCLTVMSMSFLPALNVLHEHMYVVNWLFWNWCQVISCQNSQGSTPFN